MNRRLRRFLRHRIQRAAYPAIGAIGLARQLRDRGRSRMDTSAPERILVIRLDLLGDVLFTMPLVEGLRAAYPQSHITVLTLPYTAPLARSFGEVNDVIAVDTNRIRSLRGLLDPGTWASYLAVYSQLRRCRFDLAVSVYGQMASLWAFLSGARRSIGYAGEAYPFLLTDPIAGGRHRERIHEVDYVRRLATHAGVSMPPGPLHCPVDNGARERVDRLLAARGIEARDRMVLIHAGSINGSAKRWPAASWSRFADRVERQASARVVLAGAASDAPIAEEVIKRAETPIVSLVGLTDVAELIALVDRADLVASGDSGPLHLAVARRRPLLAAYGPTDPAVYGPYTPAAPTSVHRRDLPCSPCYSLAASAECPLGDPICMRLITVSEMVESALRLLSA